MIDVLAKSDFVHGGLEMIKGEDRPLPDQLAKDLRDAGLVTYAVDATSSKAAEPVLNKVAQKASKKLREKRALTAQPVESSADVCTDPGAILPDITSLDGAPVLQGNAAGDVV